jgi:hypothetical protein
MTFRTPALAALFATLTLACGGKLVDEAPFTSSGEQLQLSWESTVPEGEASLWLDYALSTASEAEHATSSRDPVYHLHGTLSVTTGGNAVYDGVLRLDSEQPPPTTTSSSVTVGARESCGVKGCDIAGRVRALPLEGLAAGSPLRIEATMPQASEDASVKELSLQLRAK